MKVVGEREIFASLVELKHHLITETIRNESEDKKTNTKALGLTKKNKISNFQQCTLGMSLYNFPGNERRQVLFMTQALESD